MQKVHSELVLMAPANVDRRVKQTATYILAVSILTETISSTVTNHDDYSEITDGNALMPLNVDYYRSREA